MGKRRHIWFGALTIVFGLSLPVKLTAAGPGIAIIGEIIQNAGSVIKSTVEGIEAAYKAGTFIIDDQEARTARAALKEIQKLNYAIVQDQAPLLFLIRSYTPGSRTWPQLRSVLFEVGQVVKTSAELLHRLAPKLPPKFSEQISQLSVLYAERTRLIDIIGSLPEPTTSDDVVALKKLGNQWSDLHKELIRLNNVIDEVMSKPKSR